MILKYWQLFDCLELALLFMSWNESNVNQRKLCVWPLKTAWRKQPCCVCLLSTKNRMNAPIIFWYSMIGLNVMYMTCFETKTLEANSYTIFCTSRGTESLRFFLVQRWPRESVNMRPCWKGQDTIISRKGKTHRISEAVFKWIFLFIVMLKLDQ